VTRAVLALVALGVVLVGIGYLMIHNAAQATP
jgi:hypothetical protein